jgi:hypothetical protein
MNVDSIGPEPTITEPEDEVEAVEDHLVVGDADDRRTLIRRDLAQQTHHNPRAACRVAQSARWRG